MIYSELQHPRPKGEKPFQDICHLLLKFFWEDNYVQLHGRKGQKQHGADITGSDNRSKLLNAACQCKGSDKNEPRQLTEQELIEEVEKAKSFEPKLDLFLVAYAGDRDAALQKVAIRLDLENRQNGLFKIVLWSWDDIVETAAEFPTVRRKIHQIEDSIIDYAVDPARPISNFSEEIASLVAQKLKFNSPKFRDDAFSEESSFEKDDLKWNAQLDVWKEQIKDGEGRAAVEPLKRFILLNSTAFSPKIAFRAHANLGAALEQFGDNEAALIEFMKAAEAEPNSPRGHAYRARAYLAQKRPVEAHQEARDALSLDPKDSLAATVYVASAPDSESLASIEAGISHHLTDTDVGLALANRYSDAGLHEDALRIAKAIVDEKNGFMRDIAIGQAIVARYQNDQLFRMLGPATAIDRQLIDEAVSALSRAWAKLKTRSDSLTWAFVAGTLGAALQFSGAADQAADAILEAYNLAPNHTGIAESAVIAFMQKSDKAQALLAAEHVKKENSPRAFLLAAEVAAWAQDWKRAREGAHEVLRLNPSNDEKLRAAEVSIIATRMLEGSSAALEAAKAFVAEMNSIGLWSQLAEVARMEGDTEQIENCLRQFEAYRSTKLGALQQFELANAFADAGRWSNAADLLDGLISPTRPTEPLRQKLFFLYRADRRKDARDLYNSIPAKLRQELNILQLGAAIFERSGLLAEAASELELAIAQRPNDLSVRLDWAKILLRMGTEKPVRKWLKNISASATGSPDDLIELAQLLDLFGNRDIAFQIAYQTLRNNWGQSEKIHLGYMGLFLRHSKANRALIAKVVSDGVVVWMRNGKGEMRRYTIDGNAAPTPELLHPDNPFVQRLLGKAAGETVHLPEGVGDAEDWTIVEIKHKYLSLFHDALEAHQTVFPETTALGRVSIDPETEGGLEPIYERARRRAQLVDLVKDFYSKNAIPLDTAAKFLGINIIDASKGFRFKSELRLDTCLGSERERNRAIGALREATRVLVDAVTLSHWQEIGFLGDVDHPQFPKILVVQPTLDILAERLQQALIDEKSQGGVIESSGDGVIFYEPKKADRKKIVTDARSLLEWVRQKCELVPTEALPDLIDREITDLLGQASKGSLATATALNVPFISDDRRLRTLAQSAGVANVSWTQAFLMKLRIDGALSGARYAELIFTLFQRRIGFVSVGSGDILNAATDEIRAGLIESLTAQGVDPTSLVSVASDLCSYLWSEHSVSDSQRSSITSMILRKTLSRSDGIDFLASIAVATYEKFAGIPFVRVSLRNRWSAYIQQFSQGHFIQHLLLSK